MKKSIIIPFIVFCFGLQAQDWELIPLVSQDILNNGVTMGGEGCQWPLAISMSKDASLMLFGTDVGGIYKSLDEGNLWQPANTGFNARGACNFAIDPFNSSRALAIGGNSVAVQPYHGIFLTTDAAETWSHALPANNSGFRDTRDQVAFDPASYNNTLGYCTDAYWITQSGTSNPGSGIYKSTDGGQNWSLFKTQYVGGILKISANGTIYIGTTQGLYRSKNKGASFVQVHSGAITGIDVYDNEPLRVYFCGAGKVYTSTNEGTAITTINPSGLAASDVKQLTVSPVNRNNMVLQTGNNFQGNAPARRYTSSDGGYNWTEATIDLSNNFMPYNLRNQDFAWHPTNPNEIWALGGDIIVKSTDAGNSWGWAAPGYSAMLIGGAFAFNVNNPNLVFLASQDYNGAATIDGGATWKYMNVSGNSWGGHIYAGYALNQQVYFGGMATCWNCPRKIAITRDAGTTFTRTNITVSGKEFSYGSPTNAQIAFCYNHRTTDGGFNWSPMSNCQGVVTHNFANTNELIGINGNSIVVSSNNGQSWSTVYTHSGGLDDVGHDSENDVFYFVSNNSLFSYNRSTNNFTNLTNSTPVDQYGNRRFKTVAVDPIEPNIVYAGSKRDVYKSENSVIRSQDNGQTWEIINHNDLSGQSFQGPAGGQEAKTIRVNPQTREAWVSTGTYGLWKIDAPGGIVVTDPCIPYPNGTPHAIPGTIHPTNYDLGGQGVSYYDTSAGNNGNGPRQDGDVDTGNGSSIGHVGWTATGEWLQYTVDITTTGIYNILYEVASVPGGGQLSLFLDSVNITGTVDVGPTGSWSIFDTIQTNNIPLTAGKYKLRFNFVQAGFDLGDITFSLASTTTCDLKLILEGAYDPVTNQMTTELLQRELLPAGQPYNNDPWNYPGTEGAGWQTADYPTNTVDWVLISFKENLLLPAIAQRAVPLLADATIPSFEADFGSSVDSVYVMVEHRNHLPILTPTKIPISGTNLTYDFTLNDSYKTSSSVGQKMIGNSWMMYASNGEQIGQQRNDINGLERILWVSDNGKFGLYLYADFNLDGDVNGEDNTIYSRNNGFFSGVP